MTSENMPHSDQENNPTQEQLLTEASKLMLSLKFVMAEIEECVGEFKECWPIERIQQFDDVIQNKSLSALTVLMAAQSALDSAVDVTERAFPDAVFEEGEKDSADNLSEDKEVLGAQEPEEQTNDEAAIDALLRDLAVAKKELDEQFPESALDKERELGDSFDVQTYMHECLLAIKENPALAACNAACYGAELIDRAVWEAAKNARDKIYALADSLPDDLYNRDMKELLISIAEETFDVSTYALGEIYKDTVRKAVATCKMLIGQTQSDEGNSSAIDEIVAESGEGVLDGVFKAQLRMQEGLREIKARPDPVHAAYEILCYAIDATEEAGMLGVEEAFSRVESFANSLQDDPDASDLRKLLISEAKSAFDAVAFALSKARLDTCATASDACNALIQGSASVRGDAPLH